MTVIINDGYLWFGNGTDYLKVFCQHILYSNLVGPELEHYEGGVNLGFDLSKEWVVIKAVGVWLDTNTKYENFVSNIKSWQKANTLQVEVIRDGTNKVKIDGSSTIYPVLMTKGLNEIEKMPGNQEKFKIEGIILEQNGAAS
ncbi:hypothetical protein LCGC14_1364930 [marine sediment metagenome]|uniref:Uncharacterized protein n=1 Tax=marine sediment metagenome TaxID=412755 RepID=A0A0F9N950_9ZZZZ